MIVRKPYAFLIKNFRLIHFFILIFSSYVLYKSNRLFVFFSNYASTRQIFSTNNATIYIPLLVFIFSILIVLFSIVIYILLREKDKPKLFYIFIIIFYILFMIFAVVSSMTITEIELEGIDPQRSRIIRDISLVFYLLQIVFCVFTLIRTLGFDIKKFHFGEDLQSLQIEVTDDEEIEIVSGINTDKLLRQKEMKKEELKAFYLENKGIIISILFLLIVVIPGIFIIKNTRENKRYNENEIVQLNNINLKILKSYTTKYDFKGKKLLKGNNSYLIVKFNLTNFSNKEIGINLTNLRLETDNNVYSANTTNYESFIDLGVGYYEQKLKGNESKDFIAVFIINDSEVINKLIVRYASNITYTNKQVNATYKRIIITPIQLNKLSDGIKVSLNENMNFNNSMLKDTNFTISAYGIKDKYTYKYNNIEKYIINDNGLVLKIDYKLELDDEINYIQDVSELISKYATLIYTYNNKEYKIDIVDITPSGNSEKSIFLSVDENMKEATNIKFIFNVRNMEYTYIIK